MERVKGGTCSRKDMFIISLEEMLRKIIGYAKSTTIGMEENVLLGLPLKMIKFLFGMDNTTMMLFDH